MKFDLGSIFLGMMLAFLFVTIISVFPFKWKRNGRRNTITIPKKELIGDVRFKYEPDDGMDHPFGADRVIRPDTTGIEVEFVRKSDNEGMTFKTKPVKLFTTDGEANCHGSPSWQYLGGILRDCISAGTYERLQRQFDVPVFLENSQQSIIPPSAWFPGRDHTFVFPTEYNLKMRVKTSRYTENLEPHVGDMRCGFGSVDIREAMRPEVEHLLEDIKSCIDIELEEWNSAWCVQKDSQNYLMIVGKWSFLIEGNRINSEVSFIRVL